MDYKDLIENRNTHNPFANNIGIEITNISDGYAKGELIINESHININDAIHGGCIYTVADTVCGSAAASCGTKAVTVNSDFHYINPGINCTKLIAEAHITKQGNRVYIIDVEVLSDNDVLLAKGTFSYYNLGTKL